MVRVERSTSIPSKSNDRHFPNLQDRQTHWLFQFLPDRSNDNAESNCHWLRTTEFDSVGRHRGIQLCTDCGKREIIWEGSIFPGEADDTSEAIRIIEQEEPYEVPDRDGLLWSISE